MDTNVNIGRILFGLIFVIGGLSGKLVLRGTNSSILLVVAGIALLLWEGIKIISTNAGVKKKLDSIVLCPSCDTKVKIPNDGIRNCPSCNQKFKVDDKGCTKL